MTDATIFKNIQKIVTAEQLELDEEQWQAFCRRMEKMISPQTGSAAVFNIDGGSRGNPGPAGIGIVISDVDGKLLSEHYEFIGQQTNNVAEYHALLKALELAAEMKISHLFIRTDSELVAKQVQGEFQVKNAQILPLYLQVERNIREFDSFSIENIPRAANQRADRLANLAISQALLNEQ